MKKENIYNIPNLLSVYRLIALPFIIWTIANGDKQLYIILLSVNLITDILDGLIARTFKLETELGARLDSLADMGTFGMAFLGMIVFETLFVKEHATSLLILIGMYLIPQIVSVIKFRKTTSFHLYSSKVVGYIQGVFLFTYFVCGYNAFYFYFMIILSCISYCEELAVVMLLPTLKSNLRSVFFILKEQKRTL